MATTSTTSRKTTPPAATQAPAAPAAPQATQAQPATTAGAAPTNAAMQVQYKLGKAYNVRPNTAQDNARSWQAIQQCIAANGGQATRAQLHAAVQQFNHVPMVGYAIRRQWLTVATPSTQAAA